MSDAPHTRSFDLPPSLIERVDRALAPVRDLPSTVAERHPILLAFCHSPAMEELIKAVMSDEHRIQRRGFHRLGTDDQVLAVGALVHTAIADDEVPLPATAFDIVKLVKTIASNLFREAAEVSLLARTGTSDLARDCDYNARAAAYRATSNYDHTVPSNARGEQEGLGDFFIAILDSKVDVLAFGYARGLPAEPGAYLYIEGLDGFFAQKMDEARKRARNERFPQGMRPLPPDDLLPGADDDLDDLSVAKHKTPPDRPSDGGLGLVLVLDSIRTREQQRDQERIESLQNLVETAQAVLHGKQRVALLAKLFSPRQRMMRRSLIIVCHAVLGDLPPEVCSDEELAALIGSPTASAAQRNYNLGRRKLLQHARDADQRREWGVILDALLPRRSRLTDESGDLRCS